MSGPRRNSIQVSISAALSRRMGIQGSISIEADDVRGILEELENMLPNGRGLLLGPNRRAKPFVRPYRNGISIDELQGLETKVVAGDAVSIMTAIAGG